MVLPNLFSKSSSKKRSDSIISKENRKTSRSSSRSPTKTSPSKPPSKVIKDPELPSSRTSSRRGNSRHQLAADTHPLNLPPEERERRRSAMSVPSEPNTPMDVDSEALANDAPSSPTPMTWTASQQSNGTSREHVNGDDSPIPPPHGSNPATSPPPKPTIDAEACKALGNKYFKAKDYSKALQEYSKCRLTGTLMKLSIMSCLLLILLMAADFYKPLVLNRNPSRTCRTVQPP